MQKRIPLVLVPCLLLTSGCSKKEEKEAEPVVPVQVTPVRQDSIRRVVVADAVLYPRDQASVMPKISAPVRKFFVNRGDHVRQNQLVAELENRDLEAAALESKALFDQAESNYRNTSSAAVPEGLTKAQTDVESAKGSLDASRKLLESREKLFREGALARRQVDEAQVAFVQARAQFEAAEQHLKALESVGKQEQIKGAAAQVEAARGHYRSSEAQLNYAQIRSPISGVVADRPVYPGEMANAGSPLLTVMDISSVVARANVPLADAAHLKVGAAATITTTDGGMEAPGKITVVSPAVDANSTTVQVWVQAANPGERLKPGASVRVAIVAATLGNVLVVPEAALLPGSEGGTCLMVVGADSVAHEKKVQAGIREGGNAQIVSGISAGEQVVVAGGVGLTDGAKVSVRKPGQKAEEEEKPAGEAKSKEK